MSTANDRRFLEDDIFLAISNDSFSNNFSNELVTEQFGSTRRLTNPSTGDIIANPSIDSEISWTLLGGLSTGCTICDITLWGGAAFVVAFLLSKV